MSSCLGRQLSMATLLFVNVLIRRQSTRLRALSINVQITSSKEEIVFLTLVFLTKPCDVYLKLSPFDCKTCGTPATLQPTHALLPIGTAVELLGDVEDVPSSHD